MQIKFSNPLGPTNGADNDGCLLSQLEYKRPLYAYTSSIAKPVGTVLRGNSDGNGGVTYEDITAALSSAGGASATVFDDVDPTSDRVIIEIDSTDQLSGVGLYLSTAGVYTGTAACIINYKNAAGVWTTLDCTLTGSLDVTGMADITFDTISGSDIALQDSYLDPINGTPVRSIVLQFTGISAVTTAPVVDMIYKLYNDTDKAITDADSFCVDDIADMPAVYDTMEVISHTNDMTMFCVEKPFALLKTTLERERLTPDAELVYSKADGTFGTLQIISMTSDSVARPEQWLTEDPGASPAVFVDIIVPPTDWGEQAITFDGEDYEHTGYWFGIRYTASSAAPALAFLAAFKCAQFSGSVGVEATETIAEARVLLNVRETSTSDSIFAAINLTTGKCCVLALLANATSAESVFTLGITKGDYIAIQQLSGSETSVVSDGFFTLTAQDDTAMKKKLLEIFGFGHTEIPLGAMSETASGQLVGPAGLILQRADTGAFEVAQEGVVYISEKQHGGIYGTIYKKFHGAQANASTVSAPGITKLVAFSGSFNGDTCYSGFAGDGISKVNMTKITDNVRADTTGWGITSGWIEYAA